MFAQISPIVKNLIIVNAIIFFGAMTLDIERMLYLYHPLGDGRFSPYQVISHMFMHADPGHLFFNMLSLFFLGPYVERALGAKKFLILYLVSGFCAMFAHLFLSATTVVGASGAVYGVLIAFATMFPNVKLMLIFPPIPIKARYLALILIGIDLFSGLSRFNTGVAHFAHLGGALAGFLMVLYWQRRR